MSATSQTITVTFFPNQPLVRGYLLLENTDPPPPVNPPSILDITGATFLLQVRGDDRSETVLAEASTANGKITQQVITLEVTYEGIVYQGTSYPTQTYSLMGTGIEIAFDATDTLNIYRGILQDAAQADLEITLSGQDPIPKGLCLEYVPCIPVTRDYELEVCC